MSGRSDRPAHHQTLRAPAPMRRRRQHRAALISSLPLPRVIPARVSGHHPRKRSGSRAWTERQPTSWRSRLLSLVGRIPRGRCALGTNRGTASLCLTTLSQATSVPSSPPPPAAARCPRAPRMPAATFHGLQTDVAPHGGGPRGSDSGARSAERLSRCAGGRVPRRLPPQCGRLACDDRQTVCQPRQVRPLQRDVTRGDSAQPRETASR